MKVLIIDDDPTILLAIAYITKKIAESMQIEIIVHTTDNANTAWEMFRNGGYDGVVSDVMMPEINGDKMVEFMLPCQCERRHRVCFITGLTDQFNQNRLVAGGVDYVLNKTEIGKVGSKAYNEYKVYLASLLVKSDCGSQSPDAIANPSSL